MVLPETIAIIRSRQIKHVLIIGIEAHICVLQTALELLSLQDELGWKVEVYVLADGVGSTHPAEVPIALSVRSPPCSFLRLCSNLTVGFYFCNAGM